MQTLTPDAAIQRSLVKRFRKELWQPFVAACKRYALVPEGAMVTVCLDGTTPMLLAAALLEELHRHSDVPFELTVTDHVAAATERFVIPDCMSDVTETVLTAMLREGETRGVLPIESPDEHGIIHIRPLYCIEEKDIRAFCRYNRLLYVPREVDPKRQMARALLDTVKKDDPDAEIRVFRALHSVHADTFPKTCDNKKV